MATQPKMKAIWEEIENLMILAGSDESLDPTLFTVSVAESGLIVTIPIGMDFRFCRGVSSCYGKSALSELTIELIPNWTSPSRPGRVNTSDRMCVVPCRKIQIPKDICGQIGNFNICLLYTSPSPRD